MPAFTPTLDGNAVFGVAVNFTAMPNPPSIQRDAYPGLNGQVSQFLGTRGGRIRVTGRYVEFDVPTVNNDLATLISYQDGIARTIVDCEGNAYFNCILAHVLPPKPAVPCPAVGGWLKEYTVEFDVLSG